MWLACHISILRKIHRYIYYICTYYTWYQFSSKIQIIKVQFRKVEFSLYEFLIALDFDFAITDVKEKKSQNQVLPLRRELYGLIQDFLLPFYLFNFLIKFTLYIVIYIIHCNLHRSL